MNSKMNENEFDIIDLLAYIPVTNTELFKKELLDTDNVSYYNSFEETVFCDFRQSTILHCVTRNNANWEGIQIKTFDLSLYNKLYFIPSKYVCFDMTRKT